MSTNQQPSAMRRKAGAGRPAPEIGRVTPARALRAAVAQAAQDVAALVAVAGNVEEGRITREPLVEALPEHPLLALVEGAENRFGLVVLDGQTVAALIEIQTTGRVVPRPAEPRAPTRTDAIMCADFIDRLLELVEQGLTEAEAPLAPVFTGFRYAMALTETRAVAMTLDDIPYRQLAVTVDFGHGAKAGGITLILPFDPPGRGLRGPGEGAAFTAALRARVMDAEADLTATLARREMTLAEVTDLAVGAVINLPRDVLAEIEIEDLRGRVLARGQLGQVEGHRAVRLVAEADRARGAGAAMTSLPGAMPRLATLDPGGALDMAGDADPLAGFGGLGGEAPADHGPGDPPATAPVDAAPVGLDSLPDADGLADLGNFAELDETAIESGG